MMPTIQLQRPIGMGANVPFTARQFATYQACPLDFLETRVVGPSAVTPTPEMQAYFESLGEVRALAERRYPQATNIWAPKADDPDDDSGETSKSIVGQIEKTEAALLDPAVPTILHGAAYFSNGTDDNGVRVHFDILERMNAGAFRLAAIRGGTKIYDEEVVVYTRKYTDKDSGETFKAGDTRVKRKLKPDIAQRLALQLYVLKQNGIKIDEAGFLYVNPDYVHTGGFEYDPGKVLVFQNVINELTALFPDIESALQAMRDLDASGDLDGMEHDEKCPFEKLELDPYDVRNLGTGGRPPAALEGSGITDIRNIPDGFVGPNGKELTDIMWARIRAIRDNVMSFDREEAVRQLKKITDLLQEEGAKVVSLDFETIQPLLPIFAGSKPYSSQTLQFSAHIFANPDNLLFDELVWKPLIEHKEFLYTGDAQGDWAKQASLAILDAVGDAGPIATWFHTFEVGRIRELAEIMFAQGEIGISARLYALIGGDKKARYAAVADKARKAGHDQVADKITELLKIMEQVGSETSKPWENLAKYLAKNYNPVYANEIEGIREDTGRIVDFYDLIRLTLYHPGFKFRDSLKYVTPALTTHDYANLPGEINKGDKASKALLELLKPDTTPARREKLIRDLLDYCKLDTLAPVSIFSFWLQVLNGLIPLELPKEETSA